MGYQSEYRAGETTLEMPSCFLKVCLFVANYEHNKPGKVKKAVQRSNPLPLMQTTLIVLRTLEKVVKDSVCLIRVIKRISHTLCWAVPLILN